MWPNIKFWIELPKINPGLAKSLFQWKTHSYMQKRSPSGCHLNLFKNCVLSITTFQKKKSFLVKKYCYFFFIFNFSFFFRGTMDIKSHQHPQPGYPIQTTYVGLISKLNHFHRGRATAMVGAFKNIL